MKPEITLRKATLADSGMMFSWRNHPNTRRYFNDPGPLERDGHEAWLARALASPATHLLIAVDGNNKSAGVLRFDSQDDGAAFEVSIYLDPSRTNRGLGKNVLAVGMKWLGENTAAAKASATVLESNLPSRRMFAALGFTTVRSAIECEIKR